MKSKVENYEVVVVGGGPAGATTATELARAGRKVLLLDRGGRIKPCGGAIPPRVINDFQVPSALLAAQVQSARMVSPRGREVDMPINGGFVGMVDREIFDPWLRERAGAAGATVRQARFDKLVRLDDKRLRIDCVDSQAEAGNQHFSVTTDLLIGADGARSIVAQQAMPEAKAPPCVAAYHEIVESPQQAEGFDGSRCDVWYQGQLSPDFYGWVFPHGNKTSIGVGSACKGFSLRQAVARLRAQTSLDDAQTVRREGAPIPMRVRRRWDDGRNVLVIGDAAGVVAPSSGEGIYYAMESGRLAAEAAVQFLQTGNVRELARCRKRFMRDHGKVFWILGMMQRFWYSSDARRERFVAICRDPDVQHLTWEAYMHKRLVKAKPAAHMRIFFKDLAHLLGFARV